MDKVLENTIKLCGHGNGNSLLSRGDGHTSVTAFRIEQDDHRPNPVADLVFYLDQENYNPVALVGLYREKLVHVDSTISRYSSRHGIFEERVIYSAASCLCVGSANFSHIACLSLSLQQIRMSFYCAPWFSRWLVIVPTTGLFIYCVFVHKENTN